MFVDARMMGARHTRGIGRVISEILPRLITRFSSCTWSVLVRWEDQVDEVRSWGFGERVEIWVKDLPWYGVREQITLPRLIRASRADRAFFFHWNVPWACPVPYAFFLHDLLLLHQPKSAHASLRHPLVRWIKREGQAKLLERACVKATCIATPTEWVRRDAEELFPQVKGKIGVVGEGVTWQPPHSPLSGGGQFCLIVGSAYPHKRIDLALRAWKVVSETYQAHELVLVSASDTFLERLKIQVVREAIPRVRFIEEVQSEDALASWYAQAELFVFASEQEGFGLPPLEALMRGCPILSSDATCLREVLPREGVRFFRSGDQAGMIETWRDALLHREHLLREIVSAQTFIRAHHEWGAAAERLASLLSLHDSSFSFKK